MEPVASARQHGGDSHHERVGATLVELWRVSDMGLNLEQGAAHYPAALAAMPALVRKAGQRVSSNAPRRGIVMELRETLQLFKSSHGAFGLQHLADVDDSSVQDDARRQAEFWRKAEALTLAPHTMAALKTLPELRAVIAGTAAQAVLAAGAPLRHAQLMVLTAPQLDVMSPWLGGNPLDAALHHCTEAAKLVTRMRSEQSLFEALCPQLRLALAAEVAAGMLCEGQAPPPDRPEHAAALQFFVDLAAVKAHRESSMGGNQQLDAVVDSLLTGTGLLAPHVDLQLQVPPGQLLEHVLDSVGQQDAASRCSSSLVSSNIMTALQHAAGLVSAHDDALGSGRGNLGTVRCFSSSSRSSLDHGSQQGQRRTTASSSGASDSQCLDQDTPGLVLQAAPGLLQLHPSKPQPGSAGGGLIDSTEALSSTCYTQLPDAVDQLGRSLFATFLRSSSEQLKACEAAGCDVDVAWQQALPLQALQLLSAVKQLHAAAEAAAAEARALQKQERHQQRRPALQACSHKLLSLVQLVRHFSACNAAAAQQPAQRQQPAGNGASSTGGDSPRLSPAAFFAADGPLSQLSGGESQAMGAGLWNSLAAPAASSAPAAAGGRQSTAAARSVAAGSSSSSTCVVFQRLRSQLLHDLFVSRANARVADSVCAVLLANEAAALEASATELARGGSLKECLPPVQLQHCHKHLELVVGAALQAHLPLSPAFTPDALAGCLQHQAAHVLLLACLCRCVGAARSVSWQQQDLVAAHQAHLLQVTDGVDVAAFAREVERLTASFGFQARGGSSTLSTDVLDMLRSLAPKAAEPPAGVAEEQRQEQQQQEQAGSSSSSGDAAAPAYADPFMWRRLLWRLLGRLSPEAQAFYATHLAMCPHCTDKSVWTCVRKSLSHCLWSPPAGADNRLDSGAFALVTRAMTVDNQRQRLVRQYAKGLNAAFLQGYHPSLTLLSKQVLLALSPLHHQLLPPPELAPFLPSSFVPGIGKALMQQLLQGPLLQGFQHESGPTVQYWHVAWHVGLRRYHALQQQQQQQAQQAQAQQAQAQQQQPAAASSHGARHASSRGRSKGGGSSSSSPAASSSSSGGPSPALSAAELDALYRNADARLYAVGFASRQLSGARSDAAPGQPDWQHRLEGSLGAAFQKQVTQHVATLVADPALARGELTVTDDAVRLFHANIQQMCERPDVVAFRRQVLALAAAAERGGPLDRQPRASNAWLHAPLKAAVAWSHADARTFCLKDEEHQQLRQQQLAKQQQRQGATDISALALAEPVPAEALGDPADWVLLQGLHVGVDRCDVCTELASSAGRTPQVCQLCGASRWCSAACREADLAHALVCGHIQQARQVYAQGVSSAAGSCSNGNSRSSGGNAGSSRSSSSDDSSSGGLRSSGLGGGRSAGARGPAQRHPAFPCLSGLLASPFAEPGVLAPFCQGMALAPAQWPYGNSLAPDEDMAAAIARLAYEQFCSEEEQPELGPRAVDSPTVRSQDEAGGDDA